MYEERLSRESDLEIFEAITSELRDPEVAQLGRIFLLLGVSIYLAAILALTTVGDFGWPGILGFSATFVPGLVMAWRRHRRRFAVRFAAT